MLILYQKKYMEHTNIFCQFWEYWQFLLFPAWEMQPHEQLRKVKMDLFGQPFTLGYGLELLVLSSQPSSESTTLHLETRFSVQSFVL